MEAQLNSDVGPIVKTPLAEGLAGLEEALAAPSVTASFRPGVHIAITGLRSGLMAHAADVERAGGLLAELVDVAPRLSNRVRLLKRDHERLLGCIDTLLAEIMQLPPEAVRVKAMELMRDVVLHRQRSSDVVYSAFSEEIGGPG